MSDSSITITWEGRDWDVDPEVLDVKQGIAIFLEHGLTLAGFYEGLENTDPRALQSLFWLMLQQGGQVTPISKCNFDVMKFLAAFGEAQEKKKAADAAAKAAEPEPVPTLPAGPPSPEPPTPPGTTPQPSPGEASTGS